MELNADQARAIATDVVAGDVWRSPLFYLLVIAISLVSSVAGAFLSAYFKRRGETLATKADFDELLRQLRATTSASEDIRAEIQDRYGAAATARSVLRERLELIVMATFDLELWLEQARSKAISGESSDFNGSPMEKISALRSIYFPEVTQEYHALNRVFLTQNQWILDVQMEALHRLRGEAVDNQHVNRFEQVHAPLLPALNALRTALIAAARARGGL